MKANDWAAKMAADLGMTGPSMTGPTPNTVPKPLVSSVRKAILPTSMASAKPPVTPSVGQSARSASSAMQLPTKTAATTTLPVGGIGALKAAAACKKAPRYSMSSKGGKKPMPRPHDRQRKKKAVITKFGEKMAFSPGSPAMGSSAPVAPDPQMQATSDGVGVLGPELMQGENQPNIAAHGFGGEMGQPIPNTPQAPQAGAMGSPIIQRLMEQLSGGEPTGLPGAGTGPMGMGDVSGDLGALGVKTAYEGQQNGCKGAMWQPQNH